MTNPNPSPSNQFKPGNQVASDAARWRRAINKAVSREVGSKRNRIMAIDKLADTLVDAGLAGDIAAIKEIGNRLDGMAHQSVSVDNTGNNRSITVQLSFVKPAESLSHDQPLAVTHTPVTIEHDTVDAADAVPVTPQADE